MVDDKIIDTNVPLTSVGMHEGASIDCQRACAQLIHNVLRGNIRVLIDAEGEILKEYRKKMYPDPNPSAGLASQFLMHLFTYRADISRVREVSLPRRGDGKDDEYEDWPDDPRLSHFDRSDRKWVALAVRYMRDENPAPIINAMDNDWEHFVDIFIELGIMIEFICRPYQK